MAARYGYAFYQLYFLQTVTRGLLITWSRCRIVSDLNRGRVAYRTCIVKDRAGGRHNNRISKYQNEYAKEKSRDYYSTGSSLLSAYCKFAHGPAPDTVRRL